MCTQLETKTARKYLSLQQSARDRHLDFNLSLLSVRNILKAKRCAYTGIILNDVENHPNKRTVDRVDNTKGYVVGNVVACCNSFNQLKGNLTPDDLTAIMTVLQKRSDIQ